MGRSPTAQRRRGLDGAPARGPGRRAAVEDAYSTGRSLRWSPRIWFATVGLALTALATVSLLCATGRRLAALCRRAALSAPPVHGLRVRAAEAMGGVAAVARLLPFMAAAGSLSAVLRLERALSYRIYLLRCRGASAMRLAGRILDRVELSLERSFAHLLHALKHALRPGPALGGLLLPGLASFSTLFIVTAASLDTPAPPGRQPAVAAGTEITPSTAAGVASIGSPVLTTAAAPWLYGRPLPQRPAPPQGRGPAGTEGAEPPPSLHFTRGRTDRMELALTFDGGSQADEAVTILDILRERSIKTTIFLTGRFIRLYPELVRRMVREGHEVGNHTMTHPHLTDYAATFRHTTLAGVDREFLARELEGAARLFRETTGEEMVPLWRAPYGEINDELMEWAAGEGYVHVGWTTDHASRESLDTLDWVADRGSPFYRSAFEMKSRLLSFGWTGKGLRGGVALMHLGTARSDDRLTSVLAPLLDELASRGYRFVRVTELMKRKDGGRALAWVREKADRRQRKGSTIVARSPKPPAAAALLMTPGYLPPLKETLLLPWREPS
ncbi:MAG TPA: polysaccharide deacetylase family protein [Deltaproteobacteria bacterium]|nr:polysaccharide deacetylase family protein [Deltaproteobacteria bacterium]